MFSIFVRISLVASAAASAFMTNPCLIAQDAAVASPKAVIETEPVPSDGDAADDVAIWIHPTDRSRSLVLGADKKDGLHAYSLDGRDLQTVAPGMKPNNVDVIYGFPLGARRVDLAVASIRANKEKQGGGVKFWTIDAATGTLDELAPGVTFPTFGGRDAYGLCAYRSARDDRHSVFINSHEGEVEQYLLASEDGVSITGRKVREFSVGSQTEGCVADPDLGRLYIGEEDVGVWEYGAEPDAGTERKLVAKVGEHGLAADVEGLALYRAPNGGGYLLISSQGNNTINVYDRVGNHDYLLTIDPQAGSLGDIEESDGLEVTNERLSDQFPQGFLVIQDGVNTPRQNFKFFAWQDLAPGRLIIDTTPTARPEAAASRPLQGN